MNLFSKFAGAIRSFFQIGGPSGPGINNNAGTIETLNSDGATYTPMRTLVSQYQQALPATETMTVPSGNTIILAQHWTVNGRVVLQGTARIVMVM